MPNDDLPSAPMAVTHGPTNAHFDSHTDNKHHKPSWESTLLPSDKHIEVEPEKSAVEVKKISLVKVSPVIN